MKSRKKIRQSAHIYDGRFFNVNDYRSLAVHGDKMFNEVGVPLSN